tara:strand:+ start:117 stop:800 length:684 start_codon:yes stop_codon:yes gene_type:complete
MGRKRKRKLYFTEDTERAIIEYNKSDSYSERNAIYNKEIHPAFEKLAENMIHTFKFYYFDVPYRDVKHNVVTFLIEKMPKYTEGKGKAFSYFSIVAKNWLILNNNNNYKKIKAKAPVTTIDTRRNVTNEIIRQEEMEAKHDFMEYFISYCTRNANNLVSKDRDLKVLYALLEIFRKRDNIENFNKKALYIMVREMTNVKTGYITRVVNVLKAKYIELHNGYRTGKRF